MAIKSEEIVLTVVSGSNINTPNNGDVIMYDQGKNLWYKTTKDELLKEQDEKIKRLNADFAEFSKNMLQDFKAFKIESAKSSNRLIDVVDKLKSEIGR